MIISKWSYFGMMLWCAISAIMINKASDDTMVMVCAIIFGSSAICFEIRALGEQLEKGYKK